MKTLVSTLEENTKSVETMFFVVENFSFFFLFLQHVRCFVVGNATKKIKRFIK